MRPVTGWQPSILDGGSEMATCLAIKLMSTVVAHEKLAGHPELGLTPGVKFSSGRFGGTCGLTSTA